MSCDMASTYIQLLAVYRPLVAPSAVALNAEQSLPVDLLVQGTAMRLLDNMRTPAAVLQSHVGLPLSWQD